MHFAPLTLAAINPRTGSTLTLQEPRIGFVKASRFRHFSSEEAFKNHLESFTKIVNLVSFEVADLEDILAIEVASKQQKAIAEYFKYPLKKR